MNELYEYLGLWAMLTPNSVSLKSIIWKTGNMSNCIQIYINIGYTVSLRCIRS